MTWFQAQQACQLAGKRLCRDDEWQGAVAGTVDPGSSSGTGGACVTSAGGPRATGDGTACRSAYGAEDMIGNLWEWVAEWHGKDNATGGLTTTGTYGSDYMYSVSSAVFQGEGANFPAAARRGGLWADGAGAGAFALGWDYAPSSSYMGIGARCCAGGGR